MRLTPSQDLLYLLLNEIFCHVQLSVSGEMCALMCLRFLTGSCQVPSPFCRHRLALSADQCMFATDDTHKASMLGSLTLGAEHILWYLGSTALVPGAQNKLLKVAGFCFLLGR